MTDPITCEISPADYSYTPSQIPPPETQLRRDASFFFLVPPPLGPLLHRWLRTTGFQNRPSVDSAALDGEESEHGQLYRPRRCKRVRLRRQPTQTHRGISSGSRGSATDDGRWSVSRRHFSGYHFPGGTTDIPRVRTHFLNPHSVVDVTAYLIPQTPRVLTSLAFFIKTFLTDNNNKKTTTNSPTPALERDRQTSASVRRAAVANPGADRQVGSEKTRRLGRS